MKELYYSSTAAFLAHYRVLTAAAGGPGAHQLPVQDRETLDAMTHLMETLAPQERTILLAGTPAEFEEIVGPDGSEVRRRERARRRLSRLLLTKGIVRG
jgi:hypothetical protein